jgi:sugar phosphate permease
MSAEFQSNTPESSDATPTPSRYRYVVLAGICLAAALAYVPRNSISAAESSIRQELDLTKKDTRWIIVGFFITYAALQIPTGQLGHVWGTRKSLPFFSVAQSIATVVFAMGGNLAALFSGRMIMGAAQSGYFPCAATTIGRWFPKTQQAGASGALGAFMSVGGAGGVALTGWLLITMGWRTVFLLYSIPGVLWAIWFYFIFRNSPADHACVNRAELELIQRKLVSEPGHETSESSIGGHDEEQVPVRWGAILTSVPMWWICGQQFFRAAGYMFYASWFATFLQESRGVSIEKSGMLNSLPLLATIAGSMLGGGVSDAILVRTGSLRLARQGLGIGSMLSCAALIFLAYTIENTTLAVLVISGGAFCGGFAGPCAYTVTIDMGGTQVAPVFSLMNMMGNIGAIVFPLIVPDIVEAGGWDNVLFLFGGIYVAAAACWCFLDPRGTIVD